MIVLADRNFARRSLDHRGRRHDADLLVRVKTGRKLLVCRRLAGGSHASRIGPVDVRVMTAEITIITSAGRREADYRLITTVLDQTAPRWRSSGSTANTGRSRPRSPS